ncbi:MAG TPA: group III truncated hemoglobin, partial [Sphingomonadaceae bacterium]|nr:group III truncated hemoglobin [Sphingomonadaceae bacterium]
MLDPSQAAVDHDRPGHDHARAMREAKRAAAEAIGIDADYVSSFVDRFYARIREDRLLGPIFAERISDWDAHLAKMKQFWRSILHNSGEFRGNPMV